MNCCETNTCVIRVKVGTGKAIHLGLECFKCGYLRASCAKGMNSKVKRYSGNKTFNCKLCKPKQTGGKNETI